MRIAAFCWSAIIVVLLSGCSEQAEGDDGFGPDSGSLTLDPALGAARCTAFEDPVVGEVVEVERSDDDVDRIGVNRTGGTEADLWIDLTPVTNVTVQDEHGCRPTGAAKLEPGERVEAEVEETSSGLVATSLRLLRQ